MADRPIIFSAPMVRALLDGRKTQTRRLLKPQIVVHSGEVPSFSWRKFGGLYPDDWFGYGNKIDGALPYAPGDRLYVREAHALVPSSAYRMSEGVSQAVDPTDKDRACVYREGWERCVPGRWSPSIHMPRWASRLTLTVTDVRVQRLQEISEADAVAEGGDPAQARMYPELGSCRHWFQDLWNSLHGPEAWDANPWVVALTFTVQHGNIDQIGGAQ